MTSSGTYSFAPNNGSLVLSALERIRVRAPSVRQEHMVTAKNELNYLLVSFGNLQPNLWKVEQITTSLSAGNGNYAAPARVVMILDAWVTTGSGTPAAVDLYIAPMSRTEYASLASKSTAGRPTTFWFNRLISPEINLWPVPDSSGPYVLKYYACVQMQDANMPGGETPDVPYLWLDALVAGLAYRLARVYAPDLEAVRKMDAKEAWDIAATQNVENTDLFLVPGLSSYYR